MRGSDFIFGCVHLLYYKRHKINPNRGGSYIDSPDSAKSKKCFQFALTVALSHDEVKKDPQR